MERITCAALRVENVTGRTVALSLPEIVVCGKRHSDCFARLYKFWNYDKDKVEQGFYTDLANFLNRRDAAKLAERNGQLTRPLESEELFSEDLW